MNPAQLVEHFDRISEAPDAVTRLRRFILDLAVRGKLVEQRPNDEPAAELLKQIQAEKARLVKDGIIRKDKPLPQVNMDEVPFEIPAAWEWVRLVELGHSQTGTTPSKNHGDHFGNHISFIKPGDLYPDRVDYTNEGLSEAGLKDSGRIAPAGTLLMVCIGTIGKCQLLDRDCSFNQQINSLTPYSGLHPSYLLAACLSDYFQKTAWAASARTTIAILNKGKWELLMLPLPPLAEQHRIVAKVDELMALCDQLEAAKNEREVQRDRLVAASMHRIGTAPTTADEAATETQTTPLPEAARFHLDHLPRLTTRPEHIKQLRQTILNLAVRGHLVPQDPKDEPATELLKRIQAEKSLLVNEGKIKKEKPLPFNENEDTPFQVPAGWLWSKLDTVSVKITDGEHLSPNKTRNGMLLLTAKHILDGGVSLDDPQYVSHEDGLRFRERCDPQIGDLLICSRGTIGRCCIMTLDAVFCLMGSVILVRLLSELVPRYLDCFLKSDEGQLFIRGVTKGMAVNALYLKDIRLCPVPLPPLAEQHRIVAKVDELMALCDQLEAQLTTIQADNRRLLEAMLHEALAPIHEEVA